jgi:catechol 2,3-dioxygenase-like lactoylglutathione lyase family enzyme
MLYIVASSASLKPTRPAMKIERIDHLNLTVADIDRSVEFYQRVLGMKAESMGEGRAALYFGQQKIHLDAAGGGDERRKTAAGAYLRHHRDAGGRGHGPSRTLRRPDPHARTARRGDRHDPVGP